MDLMVAILAELKSIRKFMEKLSRMGMIVNLSGSCEQTSNVTGALTVT
jgi:hypothetical protein